MFPFIFGKQHFFVLSLSKQFKRNKESFFVLNIYKINLTSFMFILIKKKCLNRTFSYCDSLNFGILAVNAAVCSASSTGTTNNHSPGTDFWIIPCAHLHHIKRTNFICSVLRLAMIAIVCRVSNGKKKEKG